MTLFLETFETDGGGPRVVIKDVIDVAGAVTTGGCEALAATAAPAERDAACVRTIREGGGRIVGRVVCDELAISARGVNPWSGWPTNPLDPELVPGGSSSGSAVAVATGVAEVGIGTDTGGSCRIPAACCGVFGLKTTHGRVSLDGVLPLAPSLDTVGPLAADLPALLAGMRLLDPALSTAPAGAVRTVGRLRVPGVDARVDAGVDAALSRSGWRIVDIELDGFERAHAAATTLLLAQAGAHHGHLLEDRPDEVTAATADKLRAARGIDPDRIRLAERTAAGWRRELDDAFARVDLLALPTLPGPPPRLDAPELLADIEVSRLCLVSNLAGVPALALPTSHPIDRVPISLQLIAPHDGEATLLAGAEALDEVR